MELYSHGVYSVISLEVVVFRASRVEFPKFRIGVTLLGFVECSRALKMTRHGGPVCAQL